MQHKATSLLGGEEIGITFTEKAITPWGGLVLFSGLAKQIGLEAALREALPFRPTSPNATDPVEIVLAFMAGVLVGSRRLAHVERLRWDEGVRRMLGLKRFVSDTTLARFFQRFTSGTVTTVFESLMRWEHRLIKLDGEILDLDSSIVERYGKQEGARLGYNPKKHRRPSHHPLLATLGQRPWVVHAWLRSGNTSSASNANAFLEEALARLTKGLKNLVAGMRDWRELEPGIEVGEVVFQAQGWRISRRVVLIRQRTKANDFVRGRELFDDPAYVYQAILTNHSDSPEEVWRFYRGHAEIENRIRELKWDYGIDGFCQKKFYATEAAFRMVCVIFNLMGLFQEKLGRKVYQTLGTLRAQMLTCGAMVGRSGRKTVLRVSLAGPWRAQFERALEVFYPRTNANCASVGSG